MLKKEILLKMQNDFIGLQIGKYIVNSIDIYEDIERKWSYLCLTIINLNDGTILRDYALIEDEFGIRRYVMLCTYDNHNSIIYVSSCDKMSPPTHKITVHCVQYDLLNGEFV